MSIRHINKKIRECTYYIIDNESGFKLKSPRKGEKYIGSKNKNHSIVFVLSGELEFSYNDYLNRRFRKGDMFFVPRSSDMYGIAIENSRILILPFNEYTRSICEECETLDFTKEIREVEYQFSPLKMTPMIMDSVTQISFYIESGISCHHLYQLKQKELFIILRYNYTRRELLELFYPLRVGNTDFRSRVLEIYQENLSLPQFAARFNMSTRNFSRKFKEEFNDTVNKWTLKQKAKHIRQRLKDPEVSVSDIVRDFNFTDLPHFNKFCKEHYQCTPAGIAKRVKRGVDE